MFSNKTIFAYKVINLVKLHNFDIIFVFIQFNIKKVIDFIYVS